VNWIDSYANAYNNFQMSVPSPVTQIVTYQWAINRSLAITNPGNGFFVVTTNQLTDPKSWPPIYYYGTFSNLIGFDRGQLLNAPNGRLIASFDISGMSDLNSAGWSTNQFLFRDVIDYLGYREEVGILAQVPEPSTLALLLVGSCLLILHAYIRNVRRKRPARIHRSDA
jgi:hypothetical protein